MQNSSQQTSEGITQTSDNVYWKFPVNFVEHLIIYIRRLMCKFLCITSTFCACVTFRRLYIDSKDIIDYCTLYSLLVVFKSILVFLS